MGGRSLNKRVDEMGRPDVYRLYVLAWYMGSTVEHSLYRFLDPQGYFARRRRLCRSQNDSFRAWTQIDHDRVGVGSAHVDTDSDLGLYDGHAG